MRIEIGINEAENSFVLSGDIDNFLLNKRVRIYLKDYLNYIRLEDSVLIPYDSDNREKILSDIQKMLSKYKVEEVKSSSIQMLLSDYFIEEENFNLFSKQAYEIRNNNCNTDDFADFIEKVKKNLKARKLYELQLLSAYHLAFSQNACNFSVPGAGKTSIVYGAYSYLKSLNKSNPKYIERVLIIGPLSSFGPWENEYEECFGRKVESKRLSGSVSKQEKLNYLYSSEPAELTLISYQAISGIIEDLILFMKKHKIMLVLDEAHKIKNTEGGVTASSVLNIGKYSKSRVVLTGTPAPNGYEDLINLFQFLWPSKQIIRFHKYQLKEMSDNPKDSRVEKLINDISPYYVRIKKSDLGLSEAINNPPIEIKMKASQRKIYDFIEKNYMEYFKDKDITESASGVLVKARLIRLMQATTNPNLLASPIDKYFSEQGINNNTYIDDSEIINEILNYKKMEVPAKFQAVLKIVKDLLENEKKVIIWAVFVQNMHDLKEFLESNGIHSKLLYGDVPVETDDKSGLIETREKIIKEFHDTNSSFKVIIANPFAVSESISLHKACQNAIYLERTFNASQFIQSKDRIHRYGLDKKNKVNYFFILSQDSIDLTIHERLEFKEKRMNDIVENEPIPLFSLVESDEDGTDDMKALIADYVKRNN